MKLPLDGVPGSVETDAKLMRGLIIDWKCSAAHFYHNGNWWVRCCAQIYNEVRILVMHGERKR